MKIIDAGGAEHDIEMSDVVVMQSAGHGFVVVDKGGEKLPAPMVNVFLKDGRSFMVVGTQADLDARLRGKP